MEFYNENENDTVVGLGEMMANAFDTITDEHTAHLFTGHDIQTIFTSIATLVNKARKNAIKRHITKVDKALREVSRRLLEICDDIGEVNRITGLSREIVSYAGLLFKSNLEFLTLHCAQTAKDYIDSHFKTIIEFFDKRKIKGELVGNAVVGVLEFFDKFMMPMQCDEINNGLRALNFFVPKN